MDLTQLRYFMAVAEQLHFGKAAASLGIAQPALSISVQRLEKSLGVTLLERTRRSVALTAAGRTLLEEGRRVIAQAALAEQMTRRIGMAGQGPLRITFAPWAAMHQLPVALREFRKKWPGLEVRLDERISRLQVEGLRNGSVDLAILNRREAQTEGLSVKVIERPRLMAAIPAAWPLARKKSLKLTDLADVPLVTFPQAWGSQMTAGVESACRLAGFVPQLAQRAAQPHTMLNLVAHELGVALVPESARHMGMQNIVLKTVAGLSGQNWFEIAMAWVPRSLTPALRAFIQQMEAASATPVRKVAADP